MVGGGHIRYSAWQKEYEAAMLELGLQKVDGAREHSRSRSLQPTPDIGEGP
jgi:hypothetical protein